MFPVAFISTGKEEKSPAVLKGGGTSHITYAHALLTLSAPRYRDSHMQNQPPAAFWSNSDPHPQSFLSHLELIRSPHVCCCTSWQLQNLWRAQPRAASHFHLSLPKGLASSPEIRSVWPTCREMCASTRPSASGPTATAMTVTRSKDRRPCSTCDHDPPLSSDLNHPPPGAAMEHGHLGYHTLKTDPSNRLSASREHVEKLMPNSKKTFIYTRATTVSNR